MDFNNQHFSDPEMENELYFDIESSLYQALSLTDFPLSGCDWLSVNPTNSEEKVIKVVREFISNVHHINLQMA